MPKDKRSFFERLTGTTKTENEEDEIKTLKKDSGKGASTWPSNAEEDSELAVEVHQPPEAIIIKTMVAGVRPEDLDISITRDMVVIKGKRESSREVAEENYFHRELFWGSFSRTILLPQEVDVEGAEANERHGLLMIKLPKIDKGRETKLKVRSSS